MNTRKIPYLIFSLTSLLCNSVLAQSQEVEKLKAMLKATENILKENEQKAIVARREGDRLRYLMRAHEIAEKSSEVSEKELRALLALQAYNFNQAHDGYNYNNAVYNALQTALAEYSAGSILKGHTDQVIFIDENENRFLSIAKNGEVQIRRNSDTSVQMLRIPLEKKSTVTLAQVAADGYSLLVEVHSIKKAYVCLYSLSESFSLDKKIEVNANLKSLQFALKDQGFYYIDNSSNAIVYSDFTSKKEFFKSGEKISLATLNSNRTKMAVVLENNKILIGDVDNFNNTKVIQIKGKPGITALEWMKDKNFLFIGFDDGSLQIFDDQANVRTYYSGLNAIEKILMSPSGSKFITLSSQGEISIWNLRQMNESPMKLQGASKISALTFSKDESPIYYSYNQKIGDGFFVYSMPTSLEPIALELRGFPTRNLTADEWQFFMRDLPYESTLEKFPANNRPGKR